MTSQEPNHRQRRRRILPLAGCQWWALVGAVATISLWFFSGAGATASSGWSDETILFGGSSPELLFGGPQVAAGADGSAIAAWASCDSVEFPNCLATVWASVKSPIHGWAPPIVVTIGDDASYAECSVATDDNGNSGVVGVAVWKGQTHAIAVILNATTGWSEWHVLDNGSAGNVSHPRLSADGDGRFLAVWSRVASSAAPVNSTVAVLSELYFADNGWQGTQRVDDLNDPGMAAVYPEAISFGPGAFGAVWFEHRGSLQFSTGPWNLTGATLRPLSSWDSPAAIDVNVGAPWDRSRILLAADGNGGAIAAWSGQEPIPGQGWLDHPRTARYDSSGGWRPPSFVNMSAGPQVQLADLRSVAGGGALLTWSAFWYANRTGNAWASFSEDSLQWESVQIGPDGSCGPIVAVFSNASSLIAWSEGCWTANNISVHGSWRPAGGTWATPGPLLPFPATAGRALAGLAGDRLGRVLAVYVLYGGYGSIAAATWEAPDLVPPLLTLDEPVEGAVVRAAAVRVSGLTEPRALVEVNGVRFDADAQGHFTVVVPLVPGPNELRATATDDAGNARGLLRNVTFDDPLPALQAALDAAIAEIVGLRAALVEAQAAGNATSEALIAATARLAAAEATGNRATAALAAARESLDNASLALNASTRELSNQTARLVSLELQIANVTAAIAAARTDLATQVAINGQRQTEMDELKQSLTRTEAEASSAKAAAEGSTAFMAVVFLLAFAFTAALQLVLHGRLKRQMDESRKL